MKYGDYKAKVVIRNKIGTEKIRLYTWRNDIITKIIEGTGLTFDPEADEKMTIVVKPQDDKP